MAWDIFLFESKRGDKYVEVFIEDQESSTIAKIIHTIDLLEQYGPNLSMPHSKKLTSELYELRIRGKVEIRIIYTFYKRKIYLLHAFNKKSQKTPRKEINLSLERYKTLTI